MRLLRFLGRHAGRVLLCGMIVVAFLPGISAALRPWLPVLVSLVLGLAIARLDVGPILREYANPRRMAVMLACLVLFIPLTSLALAGLGHWLNLGPDTLLALAVFGASPPISSAASLAFMLGYDARTALQFGLLATLSLPVLGPLTLTLVGIDVDMASIDMALQIALMIAGGFALGLAIQALLGKARIAANSDSFNGTTALAMLLFLFPLFDGVIGFIRAQPTQAVTLTLLAISLNFGGHLAVACIARRITGRPTASAAGLMFGNRNVSFYLAVLPANPALGLFIAASQIPMYTTPLLFGWRRGRSPALTPLGK